MTKYLDVDGYVWERVGPRSLRVVLTPEGEPMGEEPLPGYIVDADFGPLTLIEEESK